MNILKFTLKEKEQIKAIFQRLNNSLDGFRVEKISAHRTIKNSSSGRFQSNSIKEIK